VFVSPCPALDEYDRPPAPGVGWVAAIPIGGLCFLVGLVLLVVGIVRRSRAKKVAFPGEPPPDHPEASRPPQPPPA
jgi:hypothetical protein